MYMYNFMYMYMYMYMCMCMYICMYMHIHVYIQLYLSVFTKTDPKKQQTQSEYHRKKTFKIEHFNPTPPPAKMIKCMRSDAMKYESDSELMDKVIKTNPAS